MIDILYKTVLNVSNKNQRGKISPSEFNTIASQALQTIYTELFADFRKSSFKSSRLQETPNYGKESANLKQAIEYWVKEEEVQVKDGKVRVPKDLFIVNSLFGNVAEYSKTDLVQFNRLKRSGRMKPTDCSPIYTLNSNEIKILPETKEKGLMLTYYRKAKNPKWTYKIVGGKELFNPDANDFMDLDMHPVLLHRLFVEILGLIGVNLKDEYISRAVAQMKQVEVINEQ